MGTNARIFVELKESDKNVPLDFFHPDFLDQFPKENGKREFDVDLVENIDIQEKIYSSRFLSIYNHYNGDPKHLGKMLVEDFDSYDEALNLVLGGDCARIEDTDVPLLPYYYMLRNSDKPNDWKECGPIETETLDTDCEYAYLFKDDSWYIINRHEDKTYIAPMPVLLD